MGFLSPTLNTTGTRYEYLLWYLILKYILTQIILIHFNLKDRHQYHSTLSHLSNFKNVKFKILHIVLGVVVIKFHVRENVSHI